MTTHGDPFSDPETVVLSGEGWSISYHVRPVPSLRQDPRPAPPRPRLGAMDRLRGEQWAAANVRPRESKDG